MTFYEMTEERYSVRKFDSSKPVEQEKLDLILRAGSIAPTGCNYQPQRVFVIRSRESLSKLEKVDKMLFGAPAALLVCYDKNESWKGVNYGEPDADCGVIDASIVMTTMMMEAHELGLGTLITRGFNSKEVAEAFSLPESLEIVCILDVGYPAEGSRPSHLHNDKKDLNETVSEL